ncbi:hypothetical protein D3C73_1103730 [compost metagenome]
MFDNFGFGDVLLQILLQHPLNQDGIGPDPPQESCRFEGTRSRMQRKMLRIHRDPGQQHGRFQRA